jgi:ATP synthase F1 complex assembly factor 2
MTGSPNQQLCSFHHDDPPPLVELQHRHWDPLLEWAKSTFDIDIQVFTSVLLHSQSAETRNKFNTILTKMDPWELAGEYPAALIEAKETIITIIAMERVTYVTKSFLIALALVKRHLTVEEAAVAAQVEVSSQIQRWGEVEDCEFVIIAITIFQGGIFLQSPPPSCARVGTDYRLNYSSRC